MNFHSEVHLLVLERQDLFFLLILTDLIIFICIYKYTYIFTYIEIHIFIIIIIIIYHSTTREQIRENPDPHEGKKISSMSAMHSIFHFLFSLSCIIALLIHPLSDTIKYSTIKAHENKLPLGAVQVWQVDRWHPSLLTTWRSSSCKLVWGPENYIWHL